MKIKFLKAYLTSKIGDVAEGVDAEVAKGLIAQGIAEEVKAETVTIEQATKGLFEQVKTFVTGLLADHTKAVEGNIGKSIKGALAASVIGTGVTVGTDGWERDPMHGLAKGEYFSLVKAAAYGRTDERLTKINKHLTKAAAGANETTPADGGYAVPVIYANRLWDDLVSDESLFGDVFSMTLTTGSSLKLPRDANTAIGSYGVTATWLGAGGGTRGEAIQVPTSKPSLGQITLQLNDLGVLCPITSDLAEDNNVALEQYIMGLSGKAINWMVNDAIVNGNSGTPAAGTPTGFVGHAGTVVADRGSADTNTITYTNIVQMLSQFVGDPSKARFLYNRQAIPQILNTSDGAGRNLYYAPGTIGDKPFGTLLGIRAQACDHMAALGSAADIALVDLSQYFAITKGAPNMAMSIHLYFDTNQLAYRWIFRMDGQPVRQAPFTQAGTNYGYMVVLGAPHS